MALGGLSGVASRSDLLCDGEIPQPSGIQPSDVQSNSWLDTMSLYTFFLTKSRKRPDVAMTRSSADAGLSESDSVGLDIPRYVSG